jgi:ParB family chromosome partitioning protein
VIGGNRRLAAARLAGIEKLPILVNKAQTRKDITIAAAVENLSQESLKPLEELNTIEDLKQELGTYDAVAAQLGKSPGWVSLRRRLHNLVPEVRQALADGDLTIEAARELGKIKDRSPQLDAWEAHKREEARRAAEPKPKRRRKSSPPSDERKSEGESNARSGKPTMPPQGGPAPAGDDVQARRVACTQAISAGADDNGVILIAALQAPVDAAQAQELASQWLNAANAETTPLELKHASSLDTGLQAQAALALALAHCELHTTSTGSTPQARAYTDWLAAHTSYQPATAPSTFTA